MGGRVHNLTYLSTMVVLTSLRRAGERAGAAGVIYRLFGTLGNGINRPTIKYQFSWFLIDELP